MMEMEYSPHHSPGNAAHLLSPKAAHTPSFDSFAAIRELRHSLARSPSKPGRHAMSASLSPSAPPSALSRAHSANAVPEPPRPRPVVKRSTTLRASRRTSPNSPLRRALGDSTNTGNCTPRTMRKKSGDRGQENGDATVDAPVPRDAHHMASRVDWSKTDKLLQPAKHEHASPMKSSPLKRSDGVMNLEAASLGSPRVKRRSLHGATFGSDFNIFDHSMDGTHGDAMDTTDKDHHGATPLAPSTPGMSSGMSSPQRRGISLRKSTLQQRAGTARSKLFPDTPRDPALARTRFRMSLDGSLPLRPCERDSTFQRGTVHDPPTWFAPPAQRAHQSAPKPHPLSKALTPSSSNSSMTPEDHGPPAPPAPNTCVRKPQTSMPPPGFSRSLPVGALRPHVPDAPTGSGSTPQASSFATPAAYQMARPLPQAFMSTGLISKRNRSIDMPATPLFASLHMPDTPSKKAYVHVSATPAPPGASALGTLSQPTHEFGSPSTPFNARSSQFSPESLGQGMNIFGSRVALPQLTRRGSFIIGLDSVDPGDTVDPDDLLPHSSTDDLPPTPTKSLSSSAGPGRPLSKGKSNSLRSSLFGRRSSLGLDMFAGPGSEPSSRRLLDGKSRDPVHTPCAPRTRRATREPVGGKPVRMASCTDGSPLEHEHKHKHEHERPDDPFSNKQGGAAPTPSGAGAATSAGAAPTSGAGAPSATEPEAPERHTPRTPQESFTPPDPSSLTISAASRHAKGAVANRNSFPPATPTGPKDAGFYASFAGHARASSSYFANDVDTALTARFASVTTLGTGEFSQVYRVETAGPAAPTTASPRAGGAGNVFAVKKSRKPYTGNKDRQRKMREVHILAALRGHEHVLEFVDSWEAKHHLYIQTAYCENGNLRDFLLHTGFKGRLDDFRIWKILLELAQGVAAVHAAGFMHLDLKPANIFVDWEGVLKIGDFGLACAFPAPPGADAEGDREYIGPEVLAGGVLDRPADVFALGMIMLEIAGNIVLPDNGASWQRLRAGDMSDLPSLTWASESSLARDDSGEPLEPPPDACPPDDDDLLAFLKPAPAPPTRTQDLVTPPAFMVDARHPQALDRLVQRMICPAPERRPCTTALLAAGGVRWVERRRRAGATVYEGNWGPADCVLGGGLGVDGEGDVEMLDI